MSDIKHILKRCESFDTEQNIRVMSLLIELEAKLIIGVDGLRVNLELLTVEQIERIESLIDELESVPDEFRI